jgi:hypothetical protein
MKKILFSFLFLLIFLNRGYSLIPPLSDEELQASDIIVEGKVLGCLLVNEQEDEKWRVRTYHSWVLIQKSIKGNVKQNQSIIVRWSDYYYVGKEEGFVGGPSDISVYPGNVLKMYLMLNKESGYYYGERWNSVEKLKSSSQKPPVKPGNIIFMEQE